MLQDVSLNQVEKASPTFGHLDEFLIRRLARDVWMIGFG